MTVGLPDAAVRESRERIRAALKNCGYDIPPTHITVNLAPADIKKEGSGFDLPMALGILGAYGALTCKELVDYLLVGELSLDGSLRGMRGALPIAVEARTRKIRNLIVPEANAREAAVVSGRGRLPRALAAGRGRPDQRGRRQRRRSGARPDRSAAAARRSSSPWTSRTCAGSTPPSAPWKWPRPAGTTS